MHTLNMSYDTGRMATVTPLVWITDSDGDLYTSPRLFSVERLPNGLYRLFHYGPGMSELFGSADAAKADATATHARLSQY